jgi:hypothetical protein
MTLNQIVDDILLTCAYVDKERTKKLHRRQIESWIHEYRLLLLKQEVSKNSVVDPTYISYLYFHFDQPASETITFEKIADRNILLPMEYEIYNSAAQRYLHAYDSIEDLPELAPLIGRIGIVSATGYSASSEAWPVTVADISRAFFAGNSKWTGSWPHASVYGKKLRLWIPQDSLVKKKIIDPPPPPPTPGPPPPPRPMTHEEKYSYIIKAGVILAKAEDYVKYRRGDLVPTPYTASAASYKDYEYPLQEDKLPRIKQMIFANELQWVFPARDTAQSSQMAKMEEQELQNNPTTLMQAGADLYAEI